jgi:hypothetical protein
MPAEDLRRAREILDASLDRPSVGRIYDYYLGGRHNYAIDREFARRIIGELPEAKIFARENRGFVRRAVRYARRKWGIRQFVDIGSGLPTQGNVHEIADEDGTADARVVYVDNDPVARAHSRVLLADTADPERHFALDGDFGDGSALWRRVTELGIEPEAPTCLLVTALLHFQVPDQRPDDTLAFYRDQLAPGSLLVLSHATDEDTPPATRAAAARYVATTSRAHLRPRAEIGAFLGDFDLVDPGLVWTPRWRPELAAAGEPPFTGDPTRALAVAGVARKP